MTRRSRPSISARPGCAPSARRISRVFAYLREAETLAETLDDPRRLGQICAHMTHAFWTTGDYDNALTCGQRALALAAATGDAVLQARVHGFLGTVYFSLGDYRRAIDVFGQAIPSYEGECAMRASAA